MSALLATASNRSRQPVAAPRPLPDPGQAVFVDVYDDDAIVQRARHGGTQSGIVDQVVKPVEHRQPQRLRGMQQSQQQRQRHDRHAQPASAQNGGNPSVVLYSHWLPNLGCA